MSMDTTIRNEAFDELSDEELLAFLERREGQMAKRKEYSKQHNNWAATKARMERDPEFAAKVKEKRKEAFSKQREKMKERIASDPEFAASVKAKRSAYSKQRRDYEKAIMAVAKERGLV